MQEKKKILVVAAHPDDEVLGCGGTIAKNAENSDVFVTILGEGISSRYEKREQAEKTELQELQEQSQNACKILGAKEVLFFSLPDNRFDKIEFLEIVKKVEQALEKFKPDIIYTHHFGDLNIDHRLTFQAVLTACRPTEKILVREIYSFEILSSTEWSQEKIEKPFIPNVYEDISLTIEKKIKALHEYKSEIKEFPHPRSLQGIEVLAQKRGMEAGLEYAEAFELIRHIKQ